MQDNLALLLQWREINQNGYLRSHVGGATSIFGVDANHDGNQQYHDNNDEADSGEDGVQM